MKVISRESRQEDEEDKSIYIAELPMTVRQKLSDHLDSLNVWRKLATYVQLNPEDVKYIQKQSMLGNSPADEFLHLWGGQYNHTMISLFALLYNNKLRNAMLIIKDNVPVDCHKYIQKCQDPVSEQSESPNTEIIRKCADKLLEINYDELVRATQNWSPENKIDQGGFGKVYRGEFKNTEVAIKAMDYKKDPTNKRKLYLQQSYNEMKCLNTLRHDNLLALYGYSINGSKPCLVYQLMKGGSLEFRLRVNSSKPPLSWQQRLSISLGVARGLYYLHTAYATPFIHGDIKPANILLDQSLQPKIGDFGLTRVGPKSIEEVMKVRTLIGTRIYLAPEYRSSKKLNTSVDIYSFGVVLLEMFSGHLMIECVRQKDRPILLKYLKESCKNSHENRFVIF